MLHVFKCTLTFFFYIFVVYFEMYAQNDNFNNTLKANLKNMHLNILKI